MIMKDALKLTVTVCDFYEGDYQNLSKSEIWNKYKILNPRGKVFLKKNETDEAVIMGPNPICP